MFRNTLGVQKRGYSNSIASPGVSILFGQAPPLQTMNEYFHEMPSNAIDTFPNFNSSSAKIETPYVAPSAKVEQTFVNTPTPAPQEVMETKASIEPVIQQEPVRTEPVQRKQWNIPEPAKKEVEIIEPIKNGQTYDQEVPPQPQAEQHSIGAPLTFGELANAYQKKNFRAMKVNDSTLPPTELQARLVYRQHRQGLPSNLEIHDAINNDIKTDKEELVQAFRQNQKELGHELSSQVKHGKKLQEEYKNYVREAHKASTGFEFESYARHPKMLEEAKKTGKYVADQLKSDSKRHRLEVEESRKLPSKVIIILFNNFLGLFNC